MALLPDSSTVNTAVNEQACFAETWRTVQEALDYFLANDPAAIATWFTTTRYITTYTQVYKYCVAPRTADSVQAGESQLFFHGETLYRQLQVYLAESFDRINAQLQQFGGWAKLACYLTIWDRFLCLARHCEAIFMYIERHWVERKLSAPQGSHPQVFRIKHLIYAKWNELVVVKSFSAFVACLSERLAKERQDHLLEFSADIKHMLTSFEVLSADITAISFGKAEPSSIQVYHKEIIPKYTQLISDHLKCSEVQTLDQLRLYWEEEIARAAFYLSPKSQSSVKDILKEHLFTPCLPLVSQSFAQALVDRNEEECAFVYGLLELSPTLLTNLDEAFARYTTEQLSKLPPDFVASVLELHSWSTKFIQRALKGRTQTIAARDTAFRAFLSQKRGGRVLELIAGQMDVGLKEGDDQLIERVLALFKLLDEKESFKAHYSKLLSLRLLSATSHEREKAVIEKLKGMCGAGFTSSLSKMLQDASLRTDQFLVITSGSWPVLPSPYAVKWPAPLAENITQYTSQYQREHPKKRLDWLPQLSNIEVACNWCSVVMNCVQYVIVECIVDDVMGDEAIARSTGLPFHVVQSELELMAQTGLVAKRSIRNRAGYQLNVDFKPSNAVFHLSSTQSDIDPKLIVNEQDVRQRSEEEQKIILQATVVKIAKRSKTINITELITQVLSSVHPWLPSARNEQVMAVIEQCTEKEYLKRSKELHELEYLP